MLLTIKTESQPVSVNRRIGIQDGRLSSALGQLAGRLGERSVSDATTTSGHEDEVVWRARGIDETWRRLSENLVAAQDTFATLDDVDAVLAEIGKLVSLASEPSIDTERRAQLQGRVDILRPRFAVLDSLDLLSTEGAVAAQQTLDRAYEALYEFRGQVDSILVNLEAAVENLRLAAAAWAPDLTPQRAAQNVEAITHSIRFKPQTAFRAQAHAEVASALTLLKP